MSKGALIQRLFRRVGNVAPDRTFGFAGWDQTSRKVGAEPFAHAHPGTIIATILSRAAQAHDRQIHISVEMLDFDGELGTRLPGHEYLRLRTGGPARPTEPWFQPWTPVSRERLEIDFVWCLATQRRVWAMAVVPVE
jgi:hypothetical protein